MNGIILAAAIGTVAIAFYILKSSAYCPCGVVRPIMPVFQAGDSGSNPGGGTLYSYDMSWYITFFYIFLSISLFTS